MQGIQHEKVPIPPNPLGPDFPDVEDVSDDENVPKSFLASGVFRPQLDDIILDEDLLEFYERLKFLVSLSPLKTAQVLYAFSSATDHLNLELEIRRSVLDLNSKAFTFYQENTWFTVDLDPPGESENEDESRFRILPARHKLFPAFQKRHKEPEYTYYLPQHYYYPYPFPHDPKYPYPTSAPPDRASSPGVLQPPAEIDADRRERRRDRERDRASRKERHGKSSKRRHSRDSETSSRDHRHRAHDSRDLQEFKRSRPDPDSPSFAGYEASHKHRRSENDRSAMEPPSPRNSSHRDRDRERDRDRDSLTLDGRDPNSAERLERRLARKQLGHSGKSRHHRIRDGDAPSDHERSIPSERVEDGGSSLKIRMTFPTKPAPQAQGTTQGPQPTSSTKELERGPNESVDTPMTGSTSSMPTPPMGAHRSILPSEPQSSSETGAQVNDQPQHQQQPHVLTIQPTAGHRKNRNNQASDAQSPQVAGAGAFAPTSNPAGLYGDEMLKKGTWTASEEAILTQAVRELSVENWHAIAMRVPGRNAKQCMQKWQTDLDPQINRLPWSVDEDERLVEAYHTFGNSWQQIAKMVETRTWYQCYNRVRAKSVKTRILLTQYEHPQSLATVGRQGKGTSATPTPSTPVSATATSAPGQDQTPNPNSSGPSNDGPERRRGEHSVKVEQMEERISSQSNVQYSSSSDRMSEQRQPQQQPPQTPQQPLSQPTQHQQHPQHQPIQHAQQQVSSAPRPPVQPAHPTQSTPPVHHVHHVQPVQSAQPTQPAQPVQHAQPVQPVQPVQQPQHLSQAQPQSQPQSQNSPLPPQSQQAHPRPSPITHVKQEDVREGSGAQPPQSPHSAGLRSIASAPNPQIDPNGRRAEAHVPQASQNQPPRQLFETQRAQPLPHQPSQQQVHRPPVPQSPKPGPPSSSSLLAQQQHAMQQNLANRQAQPSQQPKPQPVQQHSQHLQQQQQQQQPQPQEQQQPQQQMRQQQPSPQQHMQQSPQQQLRPTLQHLKSEGAPQESRAGLGIRSYSTGSFH
ncbi:DNA binding transcription coactivator transcription factor, partial [Podila horticola]